MTKYILILVSALLSVFGELAAAQMHGPTSSKEEVPQPTAPDNDSIMLRTQDPGSPYYYPTLMLRYRNGDSALTREDYRHLYYGFAFREEYKPHEKIEAEQNIAEILNRKQTLGTEDAKELLHFAGKVMESDPFSPSNINIMTYAYGLLGDTLNERLSARRLEGVLDAIRSSGTGLVDSSPWHIIWQTHAEDLVTMLGGEVYRYIIITKTVEYIALKVHLGKTKGFYFDYSRIYWKKPENTNKRRTDGIMIGPTYVPYR